MSALGINLHQIVRQCIPALHPDETVLLIQSTGSVNVRGRMTPQYAPVIAVEAQIQSMGNDDLQSMESEARTKISRKAWLFSQTANELIPQGIIRSLQRGGDLLYRTDGSWWLVTAMMEDFSKSGWVSVSIVEQIEVPEEVEEMVADFLKDALVTAINDAVAAYKSEDEDEIETLTNDELSKAIYDVLLEFHPKAEEEQPEDGDDIEQEPETDEDEV